MATLIVLALGAILLSGALTITSLLTERRHARLDAEFARTLHEATTEHQPHS